MASILADFSPASTASAVEANLCSLFDFLKAWPRIELHDDGACCWTLSHLPFPLFNSVVRARLAPDAADAVIDERIRACSDRNVPMLWWTGPSTAPADLGNRLEHAASCSSPRWGWSAISTTSARNRARPLSISNRCVMRQRWQRGAACCATPLARRTRLATCLRIWPAQSGSSHRRRCGIFLDASTANRWRRARVFLGAGVAGIYDVGTLPERRRRGIGAAITRAAIADAAASGYRMAILHSSTLGAACIARSDSTTCARSGNTYGRRSSSADDP